MMTDKKIEESPKQTEGELLEAYRCQQFLLLGFTQYQTNVLLKVPGLYVSCVREQYINKGCSPEMAYSILRP